MEVLLFMVGYFTLDWASYIHPLHGLNITPWNPAPAIGVFMLMRFGAVMALPLVLAIIAGDVWVRGLPESLFNSFMIACQLALGYWDIAIAVRAVSPGATMLADHGHLQRWASIVAVGTLLNSALFACLLWFLELVPSGDLRETIIQHWIGDAVGIIVTMPMLAMILDSKARASLLSKIEKPEALAVLGATGVALWLAFGIGTETDFEYFYVLFLPVVWSSIRHGTTGAVLSVSIVQIGIILVVQSLGFTVSTVLEIQTLAVVLALFSFSVGIVVDERQRLSDELQHSVRLAAAGEVAGALAHELNQPLMALASYGAACDELLRADDTGDRLRHTVRQMVKESFRAADVLRRLRDFFRTGTTRLEVVDVSSLLNSITDQFRDAAKRQRIAFSVDSGPPREILGDRLQLEIVLRNLLLNAFDAVESTPPSNKEVLLKAETDAIGRVFIAVEDSGPGLSAADAERIFHPFYSSKENGLGLGLAISEAIIDAHGGKLWAEPGSRGLFKIVLQAKVDELDGK